MRIAVEGCCHDELEIIYDTIEHIEKAKNTKIDLLLICGDFEAIRNPDDLMCMAVPQKYRDMKYFYKYYKGEKTAPMLTIIIGGNHEASNHMQELPYGGWLAKNMYYLGYAGIINVGGIRIGGMSGIYKGKDYHKGHFEKPPYNDDTVRSCYHTRSLEVFRLKQVSQPVDIMMSHDWPLHAVHAGNTEQLLRWKPDFRDEIQQDSLGSPAAQEVLTHIKPTYWFSAHLHCKYPAVIKHKCQEGEEAKVTKFLALDKCLPKRDFLQVFDMPSTKEPPYKIELDPEWLVILKNTNHLLNITSTVRYMPGVGCNERYDFKVSDKEIKKLLADFGGDMTLPENFEVTAVPYDGKSNKKAGSKPMCRVNPQTELLTQMLGITDPFAVFCGKSVEENPDEINLEMDSETSETTTQDSEPDDNMADSDQAHNSTLDTTSSAEKYPTFMLSMSASESMLNDSASDEASQNNPTSSTPAAHASSMDTSASANSDEVGSVKSPPFVVSPLSLPKPRLESDSAESMDSSSNRKRQSVEDTPAVINEEKDTESKAESRAKKFKRRNVAMYSILSNQGREEETEPT